MQVIGFQHRDTEGTGLHSVLCATPQLRAFCVKPAAGESCYENINSKAKDYTSKNGLAANS